MNYVAVVFEGLKDFFRTILWMFFPQDYHLPKKLRRKFPRWVWCWSYVLFPVVIVVLWFWSICLLVFAI